jgi:hypothetical protein
MIASDIPIQRFPHGMSHIAVSIITREKAMITFLFTHLPFSENARYRPAIIHERYMIDHMEKVNPAGVIGVGYISDMSACVMPPMRYGESGILTSVVKPMTRREVIKRRYLYIEKIILEK